MALNQKIRLQIISALDDAGIKATADQLEKLQAKVDQTGASAQGLGKQFSSAFNPMEAIMSVATGNINGMAKAAVQLGLAIKGVTVSVATMTGIFGGIMLAVTVIQKLISHFKEAREEAQKTAKEINDSFVKSASESLEQMKSGYSNYTSKIDDATKAKLRELDATQKLVEAEMRRKMLAEGASETEIKQATELARLKFKQEKSSITGEGAAEAEQYRKELIKSARAKMLGIYARSHDQSAAAQKKADEKEAEFEAKERGYAGIDYTAGTEPKLDEAQRRRVYTKMWFFKKTDEYKNLWKDYQKTIAEANKLREFVEQLEAAEMKAADEKKINEINAQEEVAKAAADAIAEERRAEDERHKQKMANLKAEAAAAMDAAKGALSAAQSRFEREFSMYKSADKGASAIEAEKADAEARKQLQKDAARYGGKWRIDELSRLYASGDEEGVKNKLAEWRKRKSFTPEVESMVRAAAAEDNVKTMEDRVSEIAENTRNLAEKVETLLTMTGE